MGNDIKKSRRKCMGDVPERRRYTSPGI